MATAHARTMTQSVRARAHERRKARRDDPASRSVGLAAGRIAIGADLARPEPVAGLGSAGSTSAGIGRIAATRDLVLGAWQLRALGDRAELRRASAAVAVADAGDALTFALAAARRRRRAARGRCAALAGAVPAAVAGVWLATRLASA